MADGALPFVPRALSERLAAVYVGLSETTFRKEVAPAVPSVRLTVGRVGWLREDLDAWLDARPKTGQNGAGVPDDADIRALAERLAAPQGPARRRARPG